MRLFTAVLLPEAAKAALGKSENALRPFCREGNFTRPENFHITLVFLGEQPPARLRAVEGAVSAAAAGVPPFSLEIGGLGRFSCGRGLGSGEFILWTGVQKGSDELQALYRALSAQLCPLGFPPDSRGYAPHLTLARRAVLKGGWEETLPAAPRGIEVPAGALSLMKSERIGGVLTYTEVFRAPLRD